MNNKFDKATDAADAISISFWKSFYMKTMPFKLSLTLSTAFCEGYIFL